MSSVLVTGVAGNVGSALAGKLLQRGYSVTGVDNFITGSRDKLPKSCDFEFVKADVNEFREISSIFYSRSFDYVFHYAALVGVKRTLDNPLMVMRDIDGIRHILELCKNCGVRRLFYSSSSEVYGEPVSLPQHETETPLNSRLPYSIVKNLGEAYIRSFNQEHALNYTIFRFFNTYGPQQSEDFVLKKFLNLALRDEPITLFGDGLQTRTFCYVDDNIDATLNCMEKGLFVNDVLNVGNDNEMSILDLAKIVVDIVGSKSEIIHLPPLKEGDMLRRLPDITKMKAALGRNLLPVREGIVRTLSEMGRE